MGAAYHLKGNLSEKQIEADVAVYLGMCSGTRPFRLLDINEQATGADKLFNVTIPIYIQFKKSEGLAPLTTPSQPRRRNESPLQEIRRYRQQNQLADNPTLFFGLRAKAKTAVEFQHNVLMANHRPGVSYGIYVAPLHLDKDIYFNDLCAFPRYEVDPWDWRDSYLHSPDPAARWAHYFYFHPFLRNHITISPHVRVTTHEHYYAFNSVGDQVSWHSPEMVDGPIARLSDFMSARTREIMAGYDELPSPEIAVDAAERALEFIGTNPQQILFGETPFDRLREYGRWLHKTHEIRQMLICMTREDLKFVREIASRR